MSKDIEFITLFLIIMGKSTGDCIHCYEYRNLRLCALNGSVCVEEDECHCDNFINRNCTAKNDTGEHIWVTDTDGVKFCRICGIEEEVNE